MKFDISSNIKSIYESVSSLDTLSTSNSHSILESALPISSKVFTALKEATADPKNLKLASCMNEDTLEIYVEALEFMNFCEAGGFITVKEAVDAIREAYESDLPEMGEAQFHVVFPDKNFSKEIIGGENLGEAVKDDWAMQLITGCSRYGIHVNSGISED